MVKSSSSIRKRVNITLAQDTLRLLDRVAPKGERSRFIDEAVRTYVAAARRSSTRWLLKEGARTRADRDLGLANEWFDLENETWHGPRSRR